MLTPHYAPLHPTTSKTPPYFSSLCRHHDLRELMQLRAAQAISSRWHREDHVGPLLLPQVQRLRQRCKHFIFRVRPIGARCLGACFRPCVSTSTENYALLTFDTGRWA